jgi:hypothetical protein
VNAEPALVTPTVDTAAYIVVGLGEDSTKLGYPSERSCIRVFESINHVDGGTELRKTWKGVERRNRSRKGTRVS